MISQFLTDNGFALFQELKVHNVLGDGGEKEFVSLTYINKRYGIMVKVFETLKAVQVLMSQSPDASKAQAWNSLPSKVLYSDEKILEAILTELAEEAEAMQAQMVPMAGGRPGPANVN